MVEDDEPPEDQEEGAVGSACVVHAAGAVTSNQTLIQWLPACTTIADLLNATAEQRTQPRPVDGYALVRVAYQTLVDVTWNVGETEMAGRTLEEAFALENLAWCQDAADEPAACSMSFANEPIRIWQLCSSFQMSPQPERRSRPGRCFRPPRYTISAVMASCASRSARPESAFYSPEQLSRSMASRKIKQRKSEPRCVF